MNLCKSIAPMALATIVLAGCGTLTQPIGERHVTYTPISADTTEVHVVMRHADRAIKAKELAYDRAMDYCSMRDKGAQMLQATSQAFSEGGFEARLVFRCVHALPSPNAGLMGKDINER